MGQRKEKVSISITPRVLELLDEAAGRARRSRSNMVETILLQRLKENEERPPARPIARSVR